MVPLSQRICQAIHPADHIVQLMITSSLAALFGFITAFIIALYAIPAIIKVAFIKKLYDKPGGRKTHRGYVPNLGGIAIFAAFLIAFICWADFSRSFRIQYLILGLLLLHFLGVKDDIVPLAPLKKLGGQIVSAAILVIPGKFRITDLYGVLGMHQLPPAVSIALSIFAVIVIINAFNLIDGVDGLAGGIALIISLAFSYTFWSRGGADMLIASLALCGALAGFLFYNKAPAKIFMGDAGSMGIGYLMAAFAFQFMQINSASPAGLFHHNPAGVIAFLIIPLFDTLRVFTLRILHGRSPFSADCNHIHHRLMSLGLSHGKTSLVLYGVNIFFIGLAYGMRDIDPNIFLAVTGILAGFLSFVPAGIKYLRQNKTRKAMPSAFHFPRPPVDPKAKSPQILLPAKNALPSEVNLN